MIINEELIVLDVEAVDKEDAINKLITIGHAAGKITSIEDFYNCVLKREEMVTTGIGNGIAIPHGKSNAIKEAIILFGRVKTPIEWNALDGNPVESIFLLGVPEESADNLHLKILAQLSRKLMNEDFVQCIHNAKTVEEIYSALSDITGNV